MFSGERPHACSAIIDRATPRKQNFCPYIMIHNSRLPAHRCCVQCKPTGTRCPKVVSIYSASIRDFANCRIRAHVWKNCRGIPSIRSREGSILFRGIDQSPYNTAPSARISLFRHGLIPAGILGASASRQVTLVTTQPQWPQILSGDYQLQDLGFHYHNPPFINRY